MKSVSGNTRRSQAGCCCNECREEEVLGVREEHSSQGTSHRFSGTVCGCMQHASIYLSISLKKDNSFCHAGHQTGTQCWGNEQ